MQWDNDPKHTIKSTTNMAEKGPQDFLGLVFSIYFSKLFFCVSRHKSFKVLSNRAKLNIILYS